MVHSTWATGGWALFRLSHTNESNPMDTLYNMWLHSLVWMRKHLKESIIRPTWVTGGLHDFTLFRLSGPNELIPMDLLDYMTLCKYIRISNKLQFILLELRNIAQPPPLDEVLLRWDDISWQSIYYGIYDEMGWKTTTVLTCLKRRGRLTNDILVLLHLMATEQHRKTWTTTSHMKRNIIYQLSTILLHCFQKGQGRHRSQAGWPMTSLHKWVIKNHKIYIWSS